MSIVIFLIIFISCLAIFINYSLQKKMKERKQNRQIKLEQSRQEIINKMKGDKQKTSV